MTQTTFAPKTWRILRNHEGRYCIHPAALDIPTGWFAQGDESTRDACLDEITRLWTDMRPDALKREMDAQERVA